ncbi:hypothetical protein [Methanohalophilus sp.]
MGGCEDIVMALGNLTAQVACLCSNSAMPAIGQPGPGYNQVVDTYLTDGTVVIEDDNGGTIPIDTERCALAQLTYAFMFEWMDETAIPLQEELASILLPAAVLAVGAAIGVTLVGIPVALITATLISLGAIAVDNQLSNLVNALIANKEEIVCALYNGLETDYQTAHRQASVVIDGMESIGFTDKQIAKALMAPWAITKAKAALDAGTAWATSNVEPMFCLVCAENALPFVYVVEFPPCSPSGWTGTWQCTDDGEMAMNGAHVATSPSWQIDNSVSWDIEIECRWRSRFPSGWTVGSMRLELWNGVDTWETIFDSNSALTTSAAAGSLNTEIETVENYGASNDLVRFVVQGQAGQGDESPWPLEIEYIRVQIEEAAPFGP